VEATHREGIQLRGERATRRRTACYARLPSKGGLDGRPNGIADERSRRCGRGLFACRSRLLRLRRLLAAPSTPSDQGLSRDQGLRGVHGTRRRFLHDQVLERQGAQGGLEDLLPPAGQQDRARQRHGHLRGPGQRRDGPLPASGTLAGFRARVRVTADSSIANLWHWDGTYSFRQG